MMHSRRLFREPAHRLALGLAMAVAGLFAGHLLAYRIVVPGPLHRALLLAGSGHGYLPMALVVGAGLGGVAAACVFLMGFRRGFRGHPGTRRLGLLGALVVPALAQACAFLALETLERALAGAPMSGLAGPLLPVGVLLQLAVGAVGGLVLFGLDRAGERAGSSLAAGRRSPRRRPASQRPPAGTPARPKPVADGSFGIRGPPIAAR